MRLFQLASCLAICFPLGAVASLSVKVSWPECVEEGEGQAKWETALAVEGSAEKQLPALKWEVTALFRYTDDDALKVIRIGRNSFDEGGQNKETTTRGVVPSNEVGEKATPVSIKLKCNSSAGQVWSIVRFDDLRPMQEMHNKEGASFKAQLVEIADEDDVTLLKEGDAQATTIKMEDFSEETEAMIRKLIPPSSPSAPLNPSVIGVRIGGD